MARERKPTKSAKHPHPLLTAFRKTFPEISGNQLATPPCFPVELEGLPAEEWPITNWAKIPGLEHWPEIWKLVASGHPEAARLPALIPKESEDWEAYEMVQVLLALTAVMGGHKALFEHHYEKAEYIWRYEYGHVMLGFNDCAPSGLAKSLMKQALLVALTYGRKEWVASFWKQLGNKAFLFMPEEGFVRREEWLFGKGDQRIFGQPERMDRLIQTHFSDQLFSRIGPKGWYLGSPTEGRVAHGDSDLSSEILSDLVRRGQEAWNARGEAKSIQQARDVFKELDVLWETSLKSKQWATFSMLQPWITPGTRDRVFLEACAAGDRKLYLKSSAHIPPGTFGAALIQLAESPLEEERARPLLDFLLGHTSPRHGSALQHAAKGGTWWLVEAILPKSDPSKHRASALRLAIEQGHWDIARSLFSTSETPNQETQFILDLITLSPSRLDESMIERLGKTDPIQVANAVVGHAQKADEARNVNTQEDPPHGLWATVFTLLPHLDSPGRQHLVTQAIHTLLHTKTRMETLVALLDHVSQPSQIDDWLQRWGPTCERAVPAQVQAAFRACRSRLSFDCPQSPSLREKVRT